MRTTLSPGTLKNERLECQIIKKFGNNKTKGPKLALNIHIGVYQTTLYILPFRLFFLCVF